MSGPGAVPEPAPMPVDREAWRRELHLSNFVNTAYQLRDLETCAGVRRVLIVGPGQGLDAHVLRWRGYEITTFDIDETFGPDHVGSVHDMARFGDEAFDAVVASHVLEHLAVPHLDTALAEIARVARYALVYLPIAGRHLQARLYPGFGRRELSVAADVFNWLEKPDGMTPRYMQGQHFWEIGLRGFRIRDLLARFAPHFEVLQRYRNPDWLASYNFVLRSKRHVR